MDPAFDWPTPLRRPALAPATPTPSSTRSTSRGSPWATPACPPSCAAPCGAGPRRRRRPPGGPRGHRGRAAAGPPARAGGVPGRAGLTNYWGYNTIGFFAPHDGYSAAVRAGAPCGQVAEFQAMVAALHAAGLEVLLDVVFNHTAEGGQAGPTLCRHRGLDNPGLLPARPGRPPPLCRHHRHRQLPQRRRPGLPAADHGLAALLAHRDGRGRVPLRPHPPWPARTAVRPAVGLLRPGPPGPGGVPGQADRRALGRRPARQLRRGSVPAGVERVERPLPRHDAGLLAPPGRARREFATRFSGSSDLYGGSREAAHRLGEPHLCA